MILGKVVGTVVSTRKLKSLVGYKLLMIQPVYGDDKQILVAGDMVGAGVGELVLVTTDDTTQYAVDRETPIDAVIVGIVDNMPVMGK